MGRLYGFLACLYVLFGWVYMRFIFFFPAAYDLLTRIVFPDVLLPTPVKASFAFGFVALSVFNVMQLVPFILAVVQFFKMITAPPGPAREQSSKSMVRMLTMASLPEGAAVAATTSILTRRLMTFTWVAARTKAWGARSARGKAA
jgi:hypothetical protein